MKAPLRTVATALTFAATTFAFAASGPKITIIDAGGVIPPLLLSRLATGLFGAGKEVIEDGKVKVKDKDLVGYPTRAHMLDEAMAVNQLFTDVLRFYKTEFNRDSFDNEGARIKAYIDVARKHPGFDLFGFQENAVWVGGGYKQFMFGVGGNDLREFASGYDVIGHEFTHAIVDSTSKLSHSGQSGALNEHLADMFGEYFQTWAGKVVPGDEFLIGEGVVQIEGIRALRDMLHPENNLRRHRADGTMTPVHPSTMSEIPNEYRSGCSVTIQNDFCGVHLIMSVPSKAVATVAVRHGWKAVTAILYPVMTQRLSSTSDFSDYRRQIAAEASIQGARAIGQAFADAFDDVGIR